MDEPTHISPSLSLYITPAPLMLFSLVIYRSSIPSPSFTMTSLHGDQSEAPSSAEKGGEMRIEQAEDINTLPDPDQGKTDEERRAIVCHAVYLFIYQSSQRILTPPS